MTYFHKSKFRPVILSLIAVTSAVWVLNACSHGKDEGESENSETPSVPSDATPPAAGTDAAPGADAANPPPPGADATAAALPPVPGADAGLPIAQASTDGASGSGNSDTPPKHKKKAHHRAKKTSTPEAAPMQDAATAPAPSNPEIAAGAPQPGTAPNAAAMTAAPPQPQAPAPQAAPPPPEPVAAAAPPPNPAADPGRAPASPRNVPPAPGEGSSDTMGMVTDMWNNNRTTIMGIAGIALLGLGGFSFWKKRQEMI